MQIHDLIQKTPEWLSYRHEHDNASEIAAVLGLSKTTTRSELLHMKHTGLGKEFSDWVQRNVLDYGHEVEAKVRPLVEALLGDDLYPVTCSNGRLSASLDGLTMCEKIAFECKQWNAEIAAQVAAGVMPEQHMPQCQQILMVTGAKKLIFAVGDGTPENLLTLDVFPDQSWFDRIRAGWEQFHEDMAVYVPTEVVAQAVGRTPETLPALTIIMKGEVSASNLGEFKQVALAAIRSVNRDLKTDQDFADSAKARKWCEDIETRVAASKDHALGQTKTIDDLFRAMDEISAEARDVRLALEKLEKARKESRRGEIVAEGAKAMAEHVSALNGRLGKPYMPTTVCDFGSAIKGLRTFDSMQNAVNTTLANAKIAASAIADRIQTNLNTLRELATGHAFLFADTAQIVLKANDDLTMLVKSRISEHQAAEAKKEAEQRERIWAEEVAKLAREQAERDRVASEQASAEAIAKAQAEAAALITHEAVVEIMMPVTVIEAMNPAPNPGKELLEAMGVKVLDVTDKAAPTHVSLAPEAIELRAEQAMPEGAYLSPAAQALNESEGAVRYAKAHTPPELKLGQMAERLGFTLTAAFLLELGFEHSATDKAAKLYHESEWPLICAALIKRIENVCELVAA